MVDLCLFHLGIPQSISLIRRVDLYQAWTTSNSTRPLTGPVAINETIRIMGEIDEVIEEHGGWPDAFVH